MEDADAAVALLAVSDEAVALFADASGGLGEPGDETAMADEVLGSVLGGLTVRLAEPAKTGAIEEPDEEPLP